MKNLLCEAGVADSGGVSLHELFPVTEVRTSGLSLQDNEQQGAIVSGPVVIKPMEIEAFKVTVVV